MIGCLLMGPSVLCLCTPALAAPYRRCAGIASHATVTQSCSAQCPRSRTLRTRTRQPQPGPARTGQSRSCHCQRRRSHIGTPWDSTPAHHTTYLPPHTDSTRTSRGGRQDTSTATQNRTRRSGPFTKPSRSPCPRKLAQGSPLILQQYSLPNTQHKPRR